MVIDCRKLNQDTDQETYPLPMINDILDKMGKSKFFVAFDMSADSYQIPVTEECKNILLFRPLKVTSSTNECPSD